MDRDAGEWWDLLFGTWMDFLCIDFGIPGMSDEKNFSFFSPYIGYIFDIS